MSSTSQSTSFTFCASKEKSTLRGQLYRSLSFLFRTFSNFPDRASRLLHFHSKKQNYLITTQSYLTFPSSTWSAEKSCETLTREEREDEEVSRCVWADDKQWSKDYSQQTTASKAALQRPQGRRQTEPDKTRPAGRTRMFFIRVSFSETVEENSNSQWSLAARRL